MGFYLKLMPSSGILLTSIWKVRLQGYNILWKGLMSNEIVLRVRQGSKEWYKVGLSENGFSFSGISGTPFELRRSSRCMKFIHTLILLQGELQESFKRFKKV